MKPDSLHTLSRRTFCRHTLTLPLLLGLASLSTPAWSQSLNDLRASGKVGEGYDGFARARDGAVAAMVDSVNAKRRAIYEQRAKEQGTSVDQVGKVYAGQIISQSPAGTWVLSASGTWQQK